MIIAIDPNVRVEGNLTYAGFEDADWELTRDDLGALVEVREVESGLRGRARIAKIDHETKLVYLAVEWSALRAPGALSTIGARLVTAASTFVLAGTPTTPAPPAPPAAVPVYQPVSA